MQAAGFFKKNRRALEECRALGHRYPEITSWIRADKGDFRLVKEVGVKETIPSDTVIFSESDEATRLYVVERGRVAIKASLQGGKWAPVCAVSPGEVFGWSCLVPPYRFTASATSLEETAVTYYEASKLRELFTREPGIGYAMMQNVAELVTSRLKNVRLELLGIVYM